MWELAINYIISNKNDHSFIQDKKSKVFDDWIYSFLKLIHFFSFGDNKGITVHVPLHSFSISTTLHSSRSTRLFPKYKSQTKKETSCHHHNVLLLRWNGGWLIVVVVALHYWWVEQWRVEWIERRYAFIVLISLIGRKHKALGIKHIYYH